MKRPIRQKKEEIGNFIRIRKKGTFLEQAGLPINGEMGPAGDQVNNNTVRKPREGWEEQFELMSANDDDPLLDEITHSDWDEEEWTW